MSKKEMERACDDSNSPMNLLVDKNNKVNVIYLKQSYYLILGPFIRKIG